MRKRRRTSSRSVSREKSESGGEDAGVSVQPLSIRGAANASAGGAGKKGRWEADEDVSV